jgi:hypothetical protein
VVGRLESDWTGDVMINRAPHLKMIRKPQTCRLQSPEEKGAIADCVLTHAMRNHTHCRHALQQDSSRLAGLARQSEAGFGLAKDNN